MPGIREASLQQMAQEWERLQETLSRVPPGRWEEPGAMGAWSAKDLLGHLATWEEETIEHLRRLMAGQPPRDYGGPSGIDAFNAQQVEAKRGRSLEQLQQELEATHQRLTAFLEGLPRELWEREEVRRRVAMDTWEHYREHQQDLDRWLGAGQEG